jgi:hypothetical protein
VRYCLLKLVDGRRFLLFRLSHASYDGTSLRVLDSQFTSMAREEAIPTPAEFRSFITYTESLNRNETLDFWERHSEAAHLCIPHRLGDLVFNAVSIVKMDNRVDSYAPQCGVTVPIVYQTAFTLLMWEYRMLRTGRSRGAFSTRVVSCRGFVR